MFVEDPEAELQIFSVAPGQGHIPIRFVDDNKFEELSFPEKFCYGIGGYHSERATKLHWRRYFNQRLLDIDGRFAKDLHYLFVAQYIVESKQLQDSNNNFIWHQKTHSAGNVTLSPADLKWTDMIQIIGRQYGKILTAEMISQMTFEEKSMWIRSNPVTAARHFQYRLNTFIHKFLLPFNIIGHITDFAIRIEFQQRGSPHAYMILWIANAPKLGIADENAITQFINLYLRISRHLALMVR